MVSTTSRQNYRVKGDIRMSLKEEIAKRLWQIYIRDEYGIEEYKDEYEYEYGFYNWTKYNDNDKKHYLDNADDILNLIEKRIKMSPNNRTNGSKNRWVVRKFREEQQERIEYLWKSGHRIKLFPDGFRVENSNGDTVFVRWTCDFDQ